jgi:ketosteroid isomerase-like protein
MMARSTRQVFDDHVAALESADMPKLIADYADDALLLIFDGSFVGTEAIKAYFEGALQAMPNLVFSLGGRVAVEGDTLLVEWSAESDTVSIPEAVDTLIIRDDKIQRQTAWVKMIPKG